MPSRSKAENGLATKRHNRGHIPIAGWLFGYQKNWLRPGVIAGLTTAAAALSSDNICQLNVVH